MSHSNDDIISKVLFKVINASVFTIFNCNQPYLQPYFTKFLLSTATFFKSKFFSHPMSVSLDGLIWIGTKGQKSVNKLLFALWIHLSAEIRYRSKLKFSRKYQFFTVFTLLIILRQWIVKSITLWEKTIWKYEIEKLPKQS